MNSNFDLVITGTSFSIGACTLNLLVMMAQNMEQTTIEEIHQHKLTARIPTTVTNANGHLMFKLTHQVYRQH